MSGKSSPRRAILHISSAHLKALLQIPEPAEIDDIALDFCQPEIVLIRIRGAGWPTLPGQPINRTIGHVTDGVIDWQLPKITGDA